MVNNKKMINKSDALRLTKVAFYGLIFKYLLILFLVIFRTVFKVILTVSNLICYL